MLVMDLAREIVSSIVDGEVRSDQYVTMKTCTVTLGVPKSEAGKLKGEVVKAIKWILTLYGRKRGFKRVILRIEAL